MIVAGLVASRGVIAVAEVSDGGAPRWIVDALSDVLWSGNTDLHIFPAPDGVVVVYRGLRRGQVVTQAVSVDSRGRVFREFPVGAAACATDTALAWIEGSKGGGACVKRMDWGQQNAVSMLTIPVEREPALVCGAHQVFALGEGEQDLTLAFGGSNAAGPSSVLRDHDFSDEEREHDTFAIDDTLGIVRIGKSGAIAIREVNREIRGQWRRLTTRLMETDDVVAVDGDSDAVTVIYTRDDSGSCDGSGASAIRALRLPRGEAGEQAVDLAPASCGKEVGPFWTGTFSGAFAVAWVEHGAARGGKMAPIVGLAYRAFGRAGLGDLKDIHLAADEVVDAGCDTERCYAVALARASGADEMQPGLVQPIPYP